MSRTLPPQTIGKLQAVAMRESSLCNYPPRPVPVPAPAIQMAELPFVARRILRLIAVQHKISEYMLRRQVGSTSDLTPALSALLRHGLVEPAHRSYRITLAGIDCAGALPGHALPRCLVVTH